jgi:hypothetical protein
MSASQESASPPARRGEPAPKRVILSTQAISPDASVVTTDKLMIKQSESPKRSKQRTKKGQRLDLRSLLHGAANETEASNNDDQGDGIEQGIANLGIKESEENVMEQYMDPNRRSAGFTMTHESLGSTESVDGTKDISSCGNVEALVKTTTDMTEYSHDDENAAVYSKKSDDNTGFDSDAYEYDDEGDDEEISSKPINLPTQARRSKKGKGDRWEPRLDRKDLIGTMDGPLAPRSQAAKKKSKKAKASLQKERRERIEAEAVRQEAILGAGGGRLVGAQAGIVNRGAGGGRMDR